MPLLVTWSLSKLLYTFAVQLLLVPSGELRRFCLLLGSCLGGFHGVHGSLLFHTHEKPFLYLQLCFQCSRSCAHHKNCWSCGIKVPLSLTSGEYMDRAWFLYCRTLLPYEPKTFILFVRKALKFKQTHSSIHAHETPHFSTPRINLFIPMLNQSTSPSRLSKIWAWARCWVPEGLWHRRYSKTCSPILTLHLWLRKAQVFASSNGTSVWRKQEIPSMFIPIWKQICLALRKEENCNRANFTWVLDLQ